MKGTYPSGLMQDRPMKLQSVESRAPRYELDVGEGSDPGFEPEMAENVDPEYVPELGEEEDIENEMDIDDSG